MRSVIILNTLALLGCGALEKYKEKAARADAPAAAEPSASASGSAEATASPAPDEFEFGRLAVGQFVEYAQTGGPGTRYGWAVVSEEDGAFWMQLVSDVSGDAQLYVMQLLLDIESGSEINGAKPKELKFKLPNGQIQRVSGALISRANKMTGSNTFMIAMDERTITKGVRKDVTVKGGSFLGAFEWIGQSQWQGKAQKTTFWSHPTVPITGIAKATDGTRTWELTRFGESGAKSEL